MGMRQVQLSLLSDLPVESGLLETCAELGVTPIGYSPLGLGVLTGSYRSISLTHSPSYLLAHSLTYSPLGLGADR
jgi:aryl-alcohol dehydrogenase-like predicted oxidoreductase